MTAFARVSRTAFDRNLVWELKSVNHRYLEHQFRLPDAARSLESNLRDAVRKRMKRGKLDCTLRIEPAETDVGIRVNPTRLEELLGAVTHIEERAPELAKISAMDILRWPGLLEETQTDEDALRSVALELFQEGLSELAKARAREGDQLKQTVSDRLDGIDAMVNELQPLCADLARVQKQRLQQRVGDLAQGLDEARLEQEVALLAQRADVAEELDRLKIHVREAREYLDAQGPHGRRLDFLTQELNREANTLGAKSILAETSQKAVDLKVLIEQIREQVQNIE